MTVTESGPAQRDDLRRRLVALTRELILFPSTSDRPDDIARCMEFVVDHVEAPEILTVYRHREKEAPSIVVLPRDIQRPEALLCAHLDVVSLPEGAEYRSTIRDGKVIGPGCGDMKGGLAVLLEIFRDFHGRYPGVSLGLAVTSDEETGGSNGFRFLFEDVRLRCGIAVMPDGGSLNEIPVEEKGIIHLRIQCRGTSAHACRPWLADNPMERMLTLLSNLRAYFDRLKVGDEHWHPTCTVTVIRTANRVPNRIPGSVEALCDIRFPSPHTAEKMLSTLQEFLDDHVEADVLIAADPTRLCPDPLFLRVTEEITGGPARLIREHGGSDARFICPYGIPVNMSRPLVGNLHTEEEWIDIASMETLYRIYERYLEMKLVRAAGEPGLKRGD